MSERFMGKVRNTLRVKRNSYRTEQSYCYWIKYYIRYHNLKHPDELGPDHVMQFLTYLTVQRHVSAATKDLKTTQIYTHVLNRGGPSVHSPLNKL